MKKIMVVMALSLAVSCSSQSKTTTEDEVTDETTKETVEKDTVETETKSTTDLGRQVVEEFYARKLDGLYKRFSVRMMKALSKEQWLAAHDQIAQGLGNEIKLIAETEDTISGIRVYRRQVNFSNLPQKSFDVTVSFGPGDVIEGFGVFETPVAAESKYLEYKTKTDLIVPWTGDWFVFWGGRTVEKNYHAKAPDQRFALDILAVGADKKTYKTDGKTNEDYLAFGRDVVAPGAGNVVSVENDVDDNVPGAMNPKMPLGNHVIIDHGNGEFSFLAHFKKGSVSVKKGAKVKRGQKLGLCGNSGNSSEPHIHYHLQDSAEPFKGEGMPIQFRSATVDGTKTDNVELEKGQTVSP